MHPAVEPHSYGLLDRPDGTRLYWEESGSPDGVAALWLHGGPGGVLGPGYRRWFDPAQVRVVGVQQRGSGRSTPRAGADAAALATCTTAAMIEDLEAVRTHLGVEQWLLTGASWGATLALAYAEQHPERVRGLVLFAVTAGTRAEVEWISDGMRRFFPEEWERSRRASGARPGERTLDAYLRRVTDADPAVRDAAVAAWMRWEDVHVSLDPAASPRPHDDLDADRDFAALVLHFWAQDCFLPEDGVLPALDRITHLPAVLVHGRLDVSSPVSTAWTLHRRWPASRLVVVDEEGHGGPRMLAHVVAGVSEIIGAL